MDDSIKMQLSGLILLLKNPDIKSKQAAFNACYQELTQAKEIVSWETIVEFIKLETGLEFDARTASNMYGRSRKKFNPDHTVKSIGGNIQPKPAVSSEPEKKQDQDNKRVRDPGQLRNLRSQSIDLDELKNGD
ncbi:hypothetical protein [Pantoea ananatis]|uniref:hypothetical protein n=1 Tax=Pantoea ananas TaxID=553 RepID=UPI0021E722D5|nr:hypothetical protein [Pantoea ananatis]MCW0309892.1 hypothetical protein [Pantoea ananatis]MCW0341626.1 hypothetical protein [Pantoea ananatis]MCW0360126.1 hypothetical protein [Pantoea ananatis]MCW0364721.1 hypothetical protein [Pantoea ananatis]MCW1777373.1 hypothetical protein [Pantoea ananatis]